jgi:flagellin
MISIQTNVTSLQAQQDLNVNDAFQNNTIQQLSSGYRINSSADDAAGLAVANQYNSDTVELQQGVRNANDGLSQLQIVDGGLSNISNMLNRMKTLATESATTTFTGNRTTLNNEYQDLVSEITRQADNIQLNNGGTLNTNLNVYIGGGRTSNVKGTSLVNINLSGTANAVDATSLNLAGTTVIGGGTSFTNNNVTNLNNANALFMSGGGGGSETFTINYANAAGNVASQAVTVTGTNNGLSASAIVSALNSSITNAGLTGISTQIGTNGDLQFSGGNLLSVTAATAGGPTNPLVQNNATLLNGANYQSTGTLVPFTAGGATTAAGITSQTLNVTVGTSNYGITLTSATTGTTAADNAADAVTSLNAQLKGSGVYATNVNNTVTLQSTSAFSVATTNDTPGAAGAGSLGTGSLFGTSDAAQAVGNPTTSASATGNAQNAISAINAAVTALGLVQGQVGAGENTLNYAISLAQSQVTNFSAAQSQIKDADIAAQAANLTKAQVLQQASIAAMAQANSSPQMVLKLLQ